MSGFGSYVRPCAVRTDGPQNAPYSERPRLQAGKSDVIFYSFWIGWRSIKSRSTVGPVKISISERARAESDSLAQER